MKLVKLQSDLFIPENFAENHKYFADAEGVKKYTGITTVLQTLAKPMLIPWAARMATEYIAEFGVKDVRDGLPVWVVTETLLEDARKAHTNKKEKAGEHGTNMHALAESWINDQLGSRITDIDYKPIQPFIDWATNNVKKFLFSERAVHSKSLFLAGTIDFGCVMKDGKRRIGDLKTGSGIYYEAILQCEAYQLLAEEEGDEKYDGSIIVRMGKDGTFQIQERERGEIDEDAFFGLYKAYRGSQTFIKPNN